MPGMGTEIFILTITDVGGDDFEVYAEGAKDETVRLTFSLDKNIANQIDMLHSRGALGYLNFVAQETACIDIGQYLFNTFFVGPALLRYRNYNATVRRPRIALQIPPSLYYLPWEVICDPLANYGQFLSMYGSVIRYDHESRPASTLYVDEVDTSTYLFLLASVEERPLSPYEPTNEEFLNFLKVEPATYSNFGNRLEKYQPVGLVFFGHGNVVEKRGYLLFLKERRTGLFGRSFMSDPKAGSVVGMTMGSVRNLRVAYMFACESAWAGKMTVFEDSITGSILKRTGLAYVIGAQTPINFFAAQEFFEHTLAAISKGYPLDLALSEGRKQVRAMDQLDPVRTYSYQDWWVPVLYARTTNFDISPKVKPISLHPQRPQQSMAAAAGSGNYLTAAVKTVGRLFHSDNEATKDILGPPRS